MNEPHLTIISLLITGILVLIAFILGYISYNNEKVENTVKEKSK